MRTAFAGPIFSECGLLHTFGKIQERQSCRHVSVRSTSGNPAGLKKVSFYGGGGSAAQTPTNQLVSRVYLFERAGLQPISLQLRVFRLGIFQDGDVRVGVLPKREEILVSSAGFGVVLQAIGASKAEAGKRT